MAVGDICIINEALIRSVREALSNSDYSDTLDDTQKRNGIRRSSFVGVMGGVISSEKYIGDFAIVAADGGIYCCNYTDGKVNDNRAVINGETKKIPAMAVNNGDRLWIKVS
ncbi:MAG: hypothetical protein J6T08_08990 [Lentisphaeria bacterium]|nr:hypothetical protein [Lentisphaeria bacterium]